MSIARVDLAQEPPDFRPQDRRRDLARVLRIKRRLRAGTAQAAARHLVAKDPESSSQRAPTAPIATTHVRAHQ
jgi:hypothetical protein